MLLYQLRIKKLRFNRCTTFFIFGPSGCGKTSCAFHALKVEQYLPIVWNLDNNDKKETYKEEIMNSIENECIRTFFNKNNNVENKGNAFIITHFEKADKEICNILEKIIDKINAHKLEGNDDDDDNCKKVIPIILIFHTDDKKNYENVEKKNIVKKCQCIIKMNSIEKNNIDIWIKFQIEKGFQKNCGPRAGPV